VLEDEEHGKFGLVLEANEQPSIPCSKPGLCYQTYTSNMKTKHTVDALCNLIASYRQSRLAAENINIEIKHHK